MTFQFSAALKSAALLSCVFAVSACGGSTYSVSKTAKESSGPVRKVPAMSIRVHRQLQKAQEAIDIKDLALADTLLSQVFLMERINDYERSVALQLQAMVAFERDDMLGAIDASEKILTFRESIPIGLELGLIYHLGQLHFALKHYEKALQYLEDWEPRAGEFVSEKQLVFMATVHYQLEDYTSAATYINKALNKAGSVPQKNWYLLLLSAYWEQQQYAAASDTLRKLISRWPDPKLCEQLAATEMAHTAGELETALATVAKEYASCLSTARATPPDAVDTARLNDNYSHSGAEDDGSEYRLLVRVQPRIPRKAIEDKVDGEVHIELTILEDGSVDKNSIVITNSNPEGYFEETVIRAASMFKYKPKMVNGKPQKVTGVKYKFTFDAPN